MNFTVALNDTQVKTLIRYYEASKVDVVPPHMKAFFKTTHCTISVYLTNKVMFQGEQAQSHYEHWLETFHLLPDILPSKSGKPDDFYKIAMGSDESGSGDYFGPLTVCAAYLNEENLTRIKALNIADSKTLSDAQIREIVPLITPHIPYSLMVLDNTKYNALIEKGYNLNSLKAYLHAQAHKMLMKKIQDEPIIIVDQFASPTHYHSYLKQFKDAPRPHIFQTKAENAYACVAIASMIARYAFLKKLDELSKALEMKLPKGAGHEVDEVASKLIKQMGERRLKTIAKIHFKNTLKAKALIK